jgi:hypothetical protein
MAVFDCNFCKVKHQRPVGKNCLKRIAAMSLTTSQASGGSTNVETSNSLIDPPPTSQSSGDIQLNNTSVSSMSGNASQPLNEDLDASGGEEHLLIESQPIPTSRSVFEQEMLGELRNINRNIEFMIRNQFEEKNALADIQQIVKVSNAIQKQFNVARVNTSTGLSVSPVISTSNNFVFCTTQAAPIYSNAGQAMAQSNSTISHAFPAPIAPHIASVRQAVPSLAELRQGHPLLAQVDSHYDELEANQLGNVSVNKRARGLLRAGGESSKHLHIDWPHDHILSGPDKNRVYYKDLNLEQWGYGYSCILQNQTDIRVKDNMINHMKNFFYDTMSYGFRRAKGAHAEVLSDMELGKYNWLNAEAISDTRKTHTQRPMTWEEWHERQGENKRIDSRDGIMDSYRSFNRDNHGGNSRRKHSSGNGKGKKTQYRLCRNYNESKCTFEGDHVQGSIIWRHACMGCKLNGHKINDCRNSDNSKN